MFELIKENYSETFRFLEKVFIEINSITTIKVDNEEYLIEKFICADLKCLGIFFLI